MSDASQVTGTALVKVAARPAGYRQALEVRARAAVTENSESPATKRALGRLALILASDQAPKPDVPRGFYLDIQV